MDTSRYLSMCLCDFRLQLLWLLSGSFVLLFRLLLPAAAAAKSFSTCTRLADAVIICVFASFGIGFVFGFAFAFAFTFAFAFDLCA